MTGLIKQLQTGLVPNPPDQSDRESLCAFIRFNDQASFAAIIQRHGPMVLRVCQRVLLHAQDAEDAFQATFLILARRAATIDKAASIAGWLHGVACRVSLRAKRDAGRRRARERQSVSPTPQDPAESLAWQDVQTLLEHEIERLPQRYRAAFILCYLEGRSRSEAAYELGILENTLSSRLARARERLKQRLSRRGVNLSAILAAVALTTGGTSASIPATLIQSTVAAAPSFAIGQSVAEISSSTLRITQEALRTMTLAKTKWTIGTLVLGATLAVGTWGAGQYSGGGAPPTKDRTPGSSPSVERPTAPERTADFAQRQRSLKNLKALAVAMHNYLDTHGQFPDDIADKDGKPLLSWRVQLLPFLDEEKLYKQLRLNESWDSEHNFKLLTQMPSVLRVGIESKDATHTYYQRFVFPDGIWDTGMGGGGSSGGGTIGGPGEGAASPPGIGGPPMPMGGAGLGPMGPGVGSGTSPGTSKSSRFPLHVGQITDGLSNTIGVIEAGPPVPWSKPADFHYNAKKPLPMKGPFANLRNVAALDGTAYSLKPDLDENTLRKLITPNDGQVVPAIKSLRATTPADSEEEKKALGKLLEQNQELIALLETQFADHAALLALANRLTKDLDRAEEQQEQLRAMIENLKLKNKKLRDDLGLGSGTPISK